MDLETRTLVASQILKGMESKINEAGTNIVGG
jgi:hypothetical protein